MTEPLKTLATIELRLGMYRAGSSPPRDQLIERMIEAPEPYMRLYVMFSTEALPDLQRIGAILLDMDKLHVNRLFLNSCRVHGEMHWQLVSLRPGVPYKTPLANQYTGSAQAGQIHRDTKAGQFRTSFGLVQNSFISRAYRDCSGYKPFIHRAVAVNFIFYELPDTGVLAVSQDPIKDYVQAAYTIRESSKHLKVHQYPLTPVNAKFTAHSRPAKKAGVEAAAEAADPQEPVERESGEPVEAPAPSNPTPETRLDAPPPVTPTERLFDEGDRLCAELNGWLNRLQASGAWRPKLETQVENERICLRLSLHREYS